MDEHEAQFMGETNARFERCFARLDKLEKDHETLHSLATSVAKLADEIKRNNTDYWQEWAKMGWSCR